MTAAFYLLKETEDERDQKKRYLLCGTQSRRRSEQGGLRPVLILQNDTGNKYSPTTIVAAITSRQSKSRLPTHVNITADGLAKDSVVLLEQIRTIDKSRLTEYVGRLDKQTMETVDRAIVISFGIQYLESLVK